MGMVPAVASQVLPHHYEVDLHRRAVHSAATKSGWQQLAMGPAQPSLRAVADRGWACSAIDVGHVAQFAEGG